MSDESELPWPTLPLGKLASEMCLGKMLDKQKNQGVLKPYLRNVNVRWFSFDLDDLKEMRFEERDVNRFTVQHGDLVVCEGGEPGRAAVWKDDSESINFQKALHRIRFGPSEYDPSFAMYFIYFGTISQRFQRYYTGTTIKHLTGASLSQVLFPIPPLAEQRRIVAKIEELFSDLDAGIAALKRAKANLKRYRAAVLKAAVEGKLTEASAHPGFEAHFWEEIGTVLTCIEQGWSPKCEREPSSSDLEWAVMKTSAVLPMRFLDYENKRLPAALAPEPGLEVKINDLLITRAGPRNRAAVTCLVRSSKARLIVCDKVYRMRCDPAKADPAFLEVVLNAPQILDELDELKTGISDSGVNLTQQRFRRLLVPIPPVSIQKQIVSEVEERFSTLFSSETEIERSLLRAARLRQSILKQAFEGKLVPQDPTDEPASELLERLRVTKAVHEENGKPPTASRKLGRRAKSSN